MWMVCQNNSTILIISIFLKSLKKSVSTINADEPLASKGIWADELSSSLASSVAFSLWKELVAELAS